MNIFNRKKETKTEQTFYCDYCQSIMIKKELSPTEIMDKLKKHHIKPPYIIMGREISAFKTAFFLYYSYYECPECKSFKFIKDKIENTEKEE